VTPSISRRDALAAVGAAGAAALAGCSSGDTDELCGTESPPHESTFDTDPLGEGPPLPDGAAWRHPNGGGARTGHAAVDGPTEDVGVAWRTRLGGRDEAGDVRVVVGDGHLLALDADLPALVGLDPVDGSERWRATAFDDPRHVAVAGGRAFVGDRAGLHAVDPADGTRSWSLSVTYERTPTPPPEDETPAEDTDRPTAVVTDDPGTPPADGAGGEGGDGRGGVNGPLLPAGDGVVFGGRFGVHAVGPDGDERWRVRRATLVAVADGVAYLSVDPGNRLVAVDAATGERRLARGETAAGRDTAVADGTLYVGGLRSVDTEAVTNGASGWSFEGEWEDFGPPGVAPDHVVAAGSPTEGDGGNQYVVDRTSGEAGWCRYLGYESLADPAVTDVTAFQGAEGTLSARSLADGTLRWRLAETVTGDLGRPFGTPALVDGALYVGSGDGIVVALTER
jgi:outer membrane protein assembly factor BamB